MVPTPARVARFDGVEPSEPGPAARLADTGGPPDRGAPDDVPGDPAAAAVADLADREPDAVADQSGPADPVHDDPVHDDPVHDDPVHDVADPTGPPPGAVADLTGPTGRLPGAVADLGGSDERPPDAPVARLDRPAPSGSSGARSARRGGRADQRGASGPADEERTRTRGGRRRGRSGRAGPGSTDAATSDQATSDQATSDQATSDQAPGDLLPGDPAGNEPAGNEPAGNEPASDDQATGGSDRRGSGQRGVRGSEKPRRGFGPAQIDPDADPVAAAREICLRLLTDRARTRQELAEALRRRGVPDEAAETVLERFDEVGLIDDAAFAGQWVRSRHRSRGLARRAIAMELRRKGVDDEVAGEALAEVDPDAEAVRARELVDRKLRTLPADTPEQRTVAARKLVGMLARKGYGGGVAYPVVREALAAHGAEIDELGPAPDPD